MTHRVLVAYVTKHGSAAGMAERIGAVLAGAGHAVDIRPAGQVDDVTTYRAVVLGSALFMLCWRKEALAFVARHQGALRERAVWLFSSGPSESSAEETHRALVRGAAKAGARVDARGHVTLTGDPEVIRWARGVAAEIGRLPAAQPVTRQVS